MGSSAATVSSWTAGPPAFRGSCSTATPRQRRRPPVGDSHEAAAQAADRRSRPSRSTTRRADDSVLVIGDPACDRDEVPETLRRPAGGGGRRRRARRGDPTDGAGKREAVPRVTPLISPPDPPARSRMRPPSSMRSMARPVADHPYRRPRRTAARRPAPRLDPRGVVLSDDSFLGPTRNWRAARHSRAGVRQLLLPGAGRRQQLLKETRLRSREVCVGRGRSADQGRRAVRRRRRLGGRRRGGAGVRHHVLRAAAGRVDASSTRWRRRATRRARCGGNTWAAYQCYGDPDWKYRRGTGDAQRPTPPAVAGTRRHRVGCRARARARDAGGEERVPGCGCRPSRRNGCGIWKTTFDAYLAEQRRSGRSLRKRMGEDRADSTRRSPGTTARAPRRTAPSSLAAVEQLANLKVRRAWEQVAQTDARTAGQGTRAQGNRRSDGASRHAARCRRPPSSARASTVRPTSASRSSRRPRDAAIRRSRRSRR